MSLKALSARLEKVEKSLSVGVVTIRTDSGSVVRVQHSTEPLSASATQPPRRECLHYPKTSRISIWATSPN